MHRQRIVLATLAFFGALTFVFPWVVVLDALPVRDYELPRAWIAPLLCATVLAIALAVPVRTQPLAFAHRIIITILAAAAAAFGAFTLRSIQTCSVDLPQHARDALARTGLGDDIAGACTSRASGSFLGMFDHFRELIAVGTGLYMLIAAGAALSISALILRKPTSR